MPQSSIISRFGTAACWCFAALISFVVFALALSWILFLDSPFQTPTQNHGPSAAQLDLIKQTQNSTLGVRMGFSGCQCVHQLILLPARSYLRHQRAGADGEMAVFDRGRRCYRH